jgi:pyruvate,orthophosphate dikinase
VQKWVYDFTEGSRDMRDLLGGKGANVAEMTRVLGEDRVPAGFTITTEACVEYMKAGQEEPEGLAEQVAEALERLEESAGKKLGDNDDPLLVSVRSGARESMPGMLDTVLNLGLNDASVEGLAKATENERFAWDSYRRFVQMFGNVSQGIPGEQFESGVRNTRDIAELAEVMPEAHEQLMDILRTLERHYKDMQDTEFTVEEGQLYMLQTRNAKRPAQAAVRFACDAVDEELLTKKEALSTIDAGGLDALLHPTFDPKAEFEVLASGVSASPGAAKGEVVFTAAAAVEAGDQGRDVILVRPFTEADDVAGFHAAKGILTSEGGKASHAALVARGMGRPAVVGADALAIDLQAKEIRVDGKVIEEGDFIAIDGTRGCVTLEDVPLREPEVNEYFERVLEWADEIRRLGVRANADAPDDAKRARELGAEGIGLCRTEHMFMAEDRQPKMRAMIMADDEESRRKALGELLPLQQGDFEGLFDAMRGLPVTIRLLDPPLHEFLPNLPELRADVERARIECTDDLDELERLLSRVEEIHEENPMLGTRGVRLGILMPEIYEMQVEAIMRAAKAVDEAPHPEIMIPLVAYEHELELMRELVVGVGSEHGLEAGEDYTVGTMIELPRACFIANRIAEHADFFSFGTNDLTQTALGFSRDDVESKFVPTYLRRKIIDRSPFETIDGPGVGWLVRLAAWVGREAHPGLKLGICGEHGGDPDSIAFFHMAGLDYVSCSPYRVPIARVAAAQATLQDS